MARQDQTVTTAPGKYATSGAVVTMTAADAANKEQFTAGGKDLVIAHNTGASQRTITISSTADAYGRTGDVSAVTIEAGKIMVFGPLPVDGWIQSDGKIYLEASHAEVEFGIVGLGSV